MPRTNQGADWQAGIMGNAGGSPALYVGVSSASSGLFSPTNTSLPGEVTTGALARQAATYSHTPGTTYYTLSCTFTSDQSITINSIGIYWTSTGNTLFTETALSEPAVLVPGDELIISEVIQI